MAPEGEAAMLTLAAKAGFTVAVTVKVDPAHEEAVGVTVYVAVCADPDALVRVPEILEAPDPVVPPVILPVTAGADQEYVVPAGTKPFVELAGVAVNAVPLQVVAVIFVTAGLGLTVTVTVKVAPEQDDVAGVTVYVAV